MGGGGGRKGRGKLYNYILIKRKIKRKSMIWGFFVLKMGFGEVIGS